MVSIHTDVIPARQISATFSITKEDIDFIKKMEDTDFGDCKHIASPDLLRSYAEKWFSDLRGDNMIKVMIQYHMIPENVEVAVVEISNVDFEFLKNANGVYNGATVEYTPEQEAANRAISESLVDPADDSMRKYASRDGFEQWFGVFHDKKVDVNKLGEPLNISGVQHIINTGCFL